VNCLSENSDVKANSPWVFLFFIYSLFHTDFFRFDLRYNNISVSISSSASNSELRAMSSAIAHFVRLQETTSQCALTLCHVVFTVLRPSALRPPASQCAPGLNSCFLRFCEGANSVGNMVFVKLGGKVTHNLAYTVEQRYC
jgi:hypothetical protein